VVTKCLAKDPDERWQSASDLASELKWIATGASGSAAQPITAVGTVPARKGIGTRVAWAVSALAVVAAAVFLVLFVRSVNRKSPVVRSQIAMEEGTFPILTGDFSGPPAVSPDGSSVAFVAARQDGAVLMWARPLNSLHARALLGTDGATLAFWVAAPFA
jgi:hypothetical protein